jgi:uncharacterized metal-binding protein YceD (DUF177 family)
MPLRVITLDRGGPVPFRIEPDAQELARLAVLAGAKQLRKVRFEGALHPIEAGGWELRGQLGATVVQPCGVTREPVSTRIDEPVLRRYLRDYAEPTAADVPLPDDVDAEPLGRVIDPGAVMFEALALALPPFPRAAGAELGAGLFAPPGRDPLAETEERPMAVLAQLRDRLRDRKD